MPALRVVRVRRCGGALPRGALPSALLGRPLAATLLRTGFPRAGFSRAALLRRALARHLGAGLAGFAQPDGDRLLAALHLGVTSLSTLERARFALVHRALHALACGLAVPATARFALGGGVSLAAYGGLLVPRRAPRRALALRGRNDRSRATSTGRGRGLRGCSLRGGGLRDVLHDGRLLHWCGLLFGGARRAATTREHERCLERRHAEGRPRESDDDSPDDVGGIVHAEVESRRADEGDHDDRGEERDGARPDVLLQTGEEIGDRAVDHRGAQ